MLSFMITLQVLVADRVERLRNDDRGATAVEYGLMVALIAGAIVVTVGLLGGELDDKFTTVCNAVGGAGSCP